MSEKFCYTSYTIASWLVENVAYRKNRAAEYAEKVCTLLSDIHVIGAANDDMVLILNRISGSPHRSQSCQTDCWEARVHALVRSMLGRDPI